MPEAYEHIPVLLNEIITEFAPTPNSRLLDATLGQGGHAEAFLKASAPSGVVVGLDADEKAVAKARERLAQYKERFTALHSNFSQLKDSVAGGGMLQEENIPHTFTHVLFDLGIGSHQLADETRGFSFQVGQGISMKYGHDTALPAAQFESLNWLERHLGYAPDVIDILRELKTDELERLIRTYGEERFAGRIARALKETYTQQVTAQELAQAIKEAVPKTYERGRLHPATRTFQALRLAVNRELEALASTLPQAVDVTEPGGVIAVISFHSLEDRIVKRFFQAEVKRKVLTLLYKKPLQATEAETKNNPRARSAKLRLARKE